MVQMSVIRHLYGSMRASFGVSTAATVVVPRSPRLRLVVLLLRMCCLNALPRRNFPFFVRLKRFAAPRCVFSFGISFRSANAARSLFLHGRRSRDRFRPPAALWLAGEDRVHLVTFHPRHRFRDGHVAQFVDEPLEDPPPDFRMRHLASAEEDRRLDLVAVLEEALDVLLLELIVVLVDLRPELDLLDQDHLLVLLGLPAPLLLLVLELAEVHDAADRRHRRRRDLDEVESFLPCDGQGLRRRHDAELLAGVVDDADFADPDALVDPHAIVAAGTTGECDKASLQNATPRPDRPCDPSSRFPRSPSRRTRRWCLRPDLRPRASAPTPSTPPIPDRPRRACRRSSAAEPLESYNRSSPAGRPARRGGRPPPACRERPRRTGGDDPKSAARSTARARATAGTRRRSVRPEAR